MVILSKSRERIRALISSLLTRSHLDFYQERLHLLKLIIISLQRLILEKNPRKAGPSSITFFAELTKLRGESFIAGFRLTNRFYGGNSFYRRPYDDYIVGSRENSKLTGKLPATIVLLVIAFSIFALSYSIQHATSSPSIIFVDNDNAGGPWDGSQVHPYQNITSGLQHAAVGDTVFVNNGTYRERLNINQSVSLVGQDPGTTIVDGGGQPNFPIIGVNAIDVTIKSFTLRNTSSDLFIGGFGILTSNSRNVTIQHNIIENTAYGIQLINTTGSKILGNQIRNNYFYAIDFRPQSSYNFIVNNDIAGNPIGVYIEAQSCSNNTFYRNNFLNSTNRHLDVTFQGPGTAWDNRAEGNYWDDYYGIDSDGDGVGDTALPHWGVDPHPLIEPWHETRTYIVPPHVVTVKCNFTVASFTFDQGLRQIRFYITGPSGWSGYCNATIPRALLSPQNASEKWIVKLGNTTLPHSNKTVDTSTVVSFRYSLSSSLLENRVRILVGVYDHPTASFAFSPDPASIVEPVNFTDTSVDSPNGMIIWRQWDFGDGNVTETTVTETTPAFILHRYTSRGLFNVTLTVRDNNTLADSVTRPVRIQNSAPSARFTFSPTVPFVGLEMEFNASATVDVDGDVTGYQWVFGDGNVTSIDTPLITHRYRHVPLGGFYKVNLTVTDNEGGTNSTERLVQVENGVSELVVEAPSSATIEDSFSVNATLRDSYAQWPLAGEHIKFSVYDNGVQHTVDSTTGGNGVATAPFSFTTVGDYSVKAEFFGSSDYVGANSTTSITLTPLDTSLTLKPPENTTQNAVATLFGTLLDEKDRPVQGATIEFSQYNGTAWEPLGSSQTNQSGIATFDYTAPNAGTYPIRAAFHGDETHAASVGEGSLQVLRAETDSTIYIVVAIVLAAIAGSAYIVFVRRKARASTPQTGKQ
jgi:parallel beta-helix repeat protein